MLPDVWRGAGRVAVAGGVPVEVLVALTSAVCVAQSKFLISPCFCSPPPFAPIPMIASQNVY